MMPDEKRTMLWVDPFTGTPANGKISATWVPPNSSSLAAGITCEVSLGTGSPSPPSITSVHFYGPPVCTCGKDVTKLVYATLADIARAYRQAAWYKKDLASIWMTDIIGGGVSWDIQYLKAISDRDIFIHPSDELRYCTWCSRTVTFERTCVEADELNYILYGEAIVLAGNANRANEKLGDLRDGLWDRTLFYNFDNRGSIDRKVKFASYGVWLYTGDNYFQHTVGPMAHPNGENNYQCKVNTSIAKRTYAISSAFYQNWYWAPIRESSDIQAEPWP